jgi:hypothetical protein
MNRASLNSWPQRLSAKLNFIPRQQLSPLSELPSFLGKAESGALDFAYIDEGVAYGTKGVAVDSEFELAPMIIPAGFEFVRYALAGPSESRTVTIGEKQPNPTQYFAHTVLNVWKQGVEALALTPVQMTICTDMLELSSRHGCGTPIMTDNNSRFVLFYFKGLLKSEVGDEELDHHLMPLLLPDMSVCWYMIPLQNTTEALQNWHNAYDRYLSGGASARDFMVSIDERMFYSDPLSIRLTRLAHIAL